MLDKCISKWYFNKNLQKAKEKNNVCSSEVYQFKFTD